MFIINGNQTEFTQWEQGKTLKNTDMAKGDAVQFYGSSGESGIMHAKEENGAVVVEVPNSMLKHAGSFTARLVKNEGRTTFSVKQAAMPESYMPVDNEQHGEGVDWEDIQNKPFGEGMVALVDNQTIPLEEGQGFTEMFYPLIAETDYTVIYNGVEYRTTAFEMNDGENSSVVLGNLSAFGGEDTGEPFVFLCMSGHITYSGVIAPLDGATEVVLTILGSGTKRLDPKYAPAPTRFYVQDGDEYIYLDETLTTKVTALELLAVKNNVELKGRTQFRMSNQATVSSDVYLIPSTYYVLDGAEYVTCGVMLLDGATNIGHRVFYTAEYTAE